MQRLWSLLLCTFLAGCAPQPAMVSGVSPSASATVPAAPVDSAAAAIPVAATIDTLHATGQRHIEPGGMRDPRTEPLFVRYASPAQAMGLLQAFPLLDPDKIRWRYSPPDSVLPKGK